MRKKPNPKLIGAFVMGAIALFVVGVLVFGGGRLFETTRTAVAYFEGSVAGLNDGAPVTFRGVRVGRVKNVALRIEPEELRARIPVYLEFQLERVDWVGDPGFSEQQIQRLIDQGLRAKLVPQSFVTGQLMVELNFHPDTPVRVVGGAEVVEIPTVRSEFDALKSQLSQLPLRDMAGAATQALTRLNEILGHEQADRLVPAAVRTLDAYRTLAEDVRVEVTRLSDSLETGGRKATGTIEQAGQSIRAIEQEMVRTLKGVRAATDAMEGELVPLARELRGTSNAAEGVFRQAEKTLESANQTLEPGSATQRDLRRALEEFANAARAVRALAEKLERNPNALITGKR